MNDVPDIRAAALTSKAWPYEEARKLLKRWPEGKPAGDPMIFETGYGPSGLPHIGTFNEVARTTFVRQAYAELTGNPTRLIAFSDDMDGLRDRIACKYPTGALAVVEVRARRWADVEPGSGQVVELILPKELD
jgi:lysyl-tRNA synthetase class 1